MAQHMGDLDAKARQALGDGRAQAGSGRPLPAVPSLPGRKAKPTIAVVTVAGPIVSGHGGRPGLPLGQRSGLNPAAHGDLVSEIKAYLAAGIDGFFSDNVAEAAEAAR